MSHSGERNPSLRDGHPMFDLLFPPAVRRLVLYPEPINTRVGLDALRKLSEQGLGLTLDPQTAVVFHSRSQDTLVVYCVAPSGDQSIVKKLDRGVFLLPIPPPGERYAVVDAAKVKTLFRTV